MSILLTTISAGSPAAAMRSQASSAPTGTSMPAEPADTTRIAASDAASACDTSAPKSWKPGVSMRLMRTSIQSQWATAAEMEMERFCSSGSWSRMEVPWSVEPSRWVAPAVWRRASQSDVLPSWLWPRTATQRMRSGVGIGLFSNSNLAFRRNPGSQW